MFSIKLLNCTKSMMTGKKSKTSNLVALKFSPRNLMFNVLEPGTVFRYPYHHFMLYKVSDFSVLNEFKN